MDGKTILNNRLHRFMVKRVSVLSMLLLMPVLFFFEQRWHVVAGLVVGSVISLLRFLATERMIADITRPDRPNGKMLCSQLQYLAVQIATVILLAVSLSASLFVGLGLAGGILLVPLIITVNAVTEAIGITRNRFGGGSEKNG